MTYLWGKVVLNAYIADTLIYRLKKLGHISIFGQMASNSKSLPQHKNHFLSSTLSGALHYITK